MAENPNTTTPTVKPDEKPETVKIDKGPYIAEENIFSGVLEGLKYWVLQFKAETDDEAQASIKTILGDGTEQNKGKWTAKQVIAIINSSIRSALRVKAQQEILSCEKDKQPQEIAKRLVHNPVLLSLEQAENWTPGERELTVQGKMREIAVLFKEGKMVEAMAKLQEVQKQVAEQLQTDSTVAKE